VELKEHRGVEGPFWLSGSFALGNSIHPEPKAQFKKEAKKGRKKPILQAGSGKQWSMA